MCVYSFVCVCVCVCVCVYSRVCTRVCVIWDAAAASAHNIVNCNAGLARRTGGPDGVGERDPGGDGAELRDARHRRRRAGSGAGRARG